MPLLKHAIKEMRKDKKKTARNRMRKESMHASIKAVEKLSKEKDATKMSEALKNAYKAIDKACKRKLLHPKTASRRKSQTAKLAKAASGK